MQVRTPPVLVTMALAVYVGLGCAGTPAVSTTHPGYDAVASSADLVGRTVGPADAGTSATLVIFFASWCHACRKELALLTTFRQQQPNLRIIGLNAYEDFQDFSDSQRLRKFLAENAPWLRVVHADKSIMRKFGGVPKIPTMFLFDRKGALVREFRRDKRLPPDVDELTAAVTQAARSS